MEYLVWLISLIPFGIISMLLMAIGYRDEYVPLRHEEEVAFLKSFGLSDEEVADIMDESWKNRL